MFLYQITYCRSDLTLSTHSPCYRVLDFCFSIFEGVFSKNAKEYYQKKNVYINPIDSEKFEKSMASCKGVLCGAGFETPAEAIYLKKKLLVIPMKNQYEQHFNAAALSDLGVPVLKSLKKKNIVLIKNWIDNPDKVQLQFPNETQQVVDKILYDYITQKRLALI